MQRRLSRGAIVTASRCFAINGDEIRTLGPGLTHPGGEGGLEQSGINTVHQDCEPASARHTVNVRQVAAQEILMGFAPGRDIVVVVAVRDGSTHDQEQNFSQGMQDPTHIARIVDRGQMLEQNREAGL